MSALAIGAVLGRRKSRSDGEFPTDPVRANSFDVDDARGRPGQRIGDGSTEYGWAFRESLVTMARKLHHDHFEGDYDGPHFMQRSYPIVLDAVLSHLDYKTGELNVPYTRIAEKARVSPNTAKRAVEAIEFWGLLNHVRRSVKVEGAEGRAGPQRKQASNAYYFDCRRRMSAKLWDKFWSRVVYNLKRVGHAVARRAVLLKHTFNERAVQAPRAKDSELATVLARMERDHFADDAASGMSASPE